MYVLRALITESFQSCFLLSCKRNYYFTEHIYLCNFFRTETIVKSALAEFALDQEFIEVTIDGRRMKTTFSIVIIADSQDDTEFYALLQSQIDSSQRNIQIIRFIRNDYLNVIMKVGNTTGKALFEQ